MFDVDAVITWVDGSDPAHKAKRDQHLAAATTRLHDNGTNPHRWVCSDELNYCVRSIVNHAPWVRHIWIVTDAQTPVLTGLPRTWAGKVSIVDHRTIFAGHEDALPTFNSLAIETMLWRIPGLAERFLYFNDDVFLTAPVTPADFFTAAGPVLRGRWVDHSPLAACPASRSQAELLNHYNQIHAAALIGYPAQHLFKSAHVVHPMLRSVMAELVAAYPAECAANARFRFRCSQQFLPQSLHNHACLATGKATILAVRDYVHVAVGAIGGAGSAGGWPARDVLSHFRRAERHEIKLLCVNDLPEVERRYPGARGWIEAAIAG